MERGTMATTWPIVPAYDDDDDDDGGGVEEVVEQE
jgi:hypothetical protein